MKKGLHIVFLFLLSLLPYFSSAQTHLLSGYETPIIPVNESPTHQGKMRFVTLDMDSLLVLMIPQSQLQDLSEAEKMMKEALSSQQSLPVEGNLELMEMLNDPEITAQKRDSVFRVIRGRETMRAAQLREKYEQLDALQDSVIGPHWDRLEAAARKVAIEKSIDIILSPEKRSEFNYEVEADITEEVRRELGLSESPR